MLDYFTSLKFEDPQFLFLLLFLPVLIVWYLFRKRKKVLTLKMSSLEAFETASSLRGILHNWLPLLRALAFIAFVLALARPQEDGGTEEIKEVIDIAMVIDLSSSMLARDFKPDRLEVSKLVASDFIDKRKADRIGLVVFAGESYTQCPITTDHIVLKDFLSKLKCGVLEDGTAIGMGLATAVNRLKNSDSVSKIVILLTDGVNNSGYVKPLTAAEIARELGVKVYTIGVGSTGAALAPVQRRSDGEYIFDLSKVEIDEALLKRISEMTGGQYFRATTATRLEEIYAEIDAMEKTEVLDSREVRIEKFRPLVWFGLFCLLLDLLLRFTVLRSLP